MIKVILFDLDNTLYDYEPAHQKALNNAYEILKKEIKISKKKFIELYNLSKTEIHKELSGTASSHNRILYFQRLIEKTHQTVEPKIILKLYEIYWGVFLFSMKLKKGVHETLKKLHKKYKIAIVSDLTTQIQLRKIKKLKLTPYIDYLTTSEEAGSEKPHAIMFLLALNKLDAKPDEAIMVGDNKVNDIMGANSVGIKTVLIGGKKTKKNKKDYSNPDYKLKEIPEVLDILEELNNGK